jgi:ATP-binding cassette subfamily B protein
MRRHGGAVRQMLALSLRADRPATVLTIVLVMVRAGAVAGTGLAQRWLVDAAGTHRVAAIAAAVVIGVLAHTALVSANRIQGNLSNDLSDRVGLMLSQEILETTAKIPTVAHLESPEYLDRLSLLRKGSRSLASVCWAVAESVSSIISLGLTMWLLYSVHPALSLVALCAIPWLVVGHRAERMLNRVKDRVAQDLRRELHLHQMCLSAEQAKEIRIAGSGPSLDEQAAELWDSAARQEIMVRLRRTALLSVGWLTFAAGFAGALTIVAHLVVAGRATAGDVLLVITLAGALRQQISGMFYHLSRVTDAGRITDHYRWLRQFAAQAERVGPAPPRRLTDGITLRGVAFSYPGIDRAVLRNIDLHLPAGATVGLVGVNGAGKTTLVKLLTGMYQPTRGSILVDGRPMSELDPTAWSAAGTAVFQDFVKWQLPVREVVGIGDLPRIEDRAVVVDAVRRAGAESLVESLPDGLDTQLGRVFDGAELSHGQWQRVALARGLMRATPVLLVLDEPTAALDPQAEHELFERFAAQAKSLALGRGAVTVLVSHRFSTVHMADLIVVLGDGVIEELGTHHELMRAGGRYAELFRTQASGYA